MPTGPVQDRGMETVTVVWVLFAMATIFLALRIYCKAKIARGMWWDDYVLILSWVREQTGLSRVWMGCTRLTLYEHSCAILSTAL